MSPPNIRFSVAKSGPESTARARALLPGLLQPAGSRGGSPDAVDPILANVRAEEAWIFDSSARGDRGETVDIAPDTRVLALEASDGTTVLLRADALAERLAQLALGSGEAQAGLDTLDLAALHPRDGTSRGVGDWIWHKLTTLAIGEDGIIDAARNKLSELTGKVGEDLAVAAGTWAGAKAIVWAIEARGRNAPGLYPWNGGVLDGNARLDEKAPQLQALATKPGLIFIHGTGSHTLGSFGHLPDSLSWPALAGHFEGRLFGFEHHSFSESPIDNALALARLLPKNARVSLVTHSRGGLVGDLLCLDASASGRDDLAARALEYRARGRQQDKDAADQARQAEHAAFVALEQKKLGKLIQLLAEKNLQIDRYVRVACPARGTALLSENLDIFLSGLLNAMRRLGDLGAGVAVSASQGLTAGKKAAAAVDKGISVFTRIVLEIAKRRLHPELLPGIEAMLPDAPMGMLLALASARPGLRMAVIAGDIEGGGLLQRLGTLFTDRKFFDRADNDLVVDTASMYGGLAGQRPIDARAIFVQGPGVNHFRYFRDDTATTDGRPLPAAQLRWLTDAEPMKLAEWSTPALPDNCEGVEPPSAPSLARSAAPGSAPLLVFLPGIMGSKLDADGDRVWLDPKSLAFGGISRIAMNAKAQITVTGLVGMAYGDLYAHLGKTHELERFDYDWRQPVADLGRLLAERLRKRVPDLSKRPVRILAHSMGGLVVRAAFAHDKTLWRDIAAHPDSALLMLGTPNRGSHLFVETLLGQSDTIRTLARLDQRHRLQQILDIVAAFPGALQLLPAPDFIDTGDIQRHKYYERSTWKDLAEINNDFWFGKKLGGIPTEKLLDDARAFWDSISDTSWTDTATDRIAYVFGQSDNTPCGILRQVDGKNKPVGIVLRGTPDGDGSVTWTSGRLAGLPDERQWLMPADHMGLTSTPEFFDDIATLLSGGIPRKLDRLPTSRGDAAAAAVRNYRAAPPAGFPTEAEATATALGGRVRRGPPRGGKARLRVSVIAMDLRFVQVPVLCGHYRGDPIAGAERIIDRNLVDGALGQRQRLGIHSGELGNASIVLMPRTPEERWRGTGRGAVVVGLGEMGKLSAAGIAETVRGGVLRYLLHAADRYGDEQLAPTRGDIPASDPNQPLPLKLASLLMGSNSALQLDVADAVKAVTLGVLMANHDFATGESASSGSAPRRARVAELQFIEVFRDSAISAANAVSQLDKALATELPGLGQQLDLADQLAFGQGVRRRLSVSPFSDYWPRLVVCDADREDTGCGPECYTPRFQSPIPPDKLRQILRIYGCGDKLADGRLPVPTGLDDAPSPSVASRLKFIYMSDKARAESVVQIRQPGTLETLCQDAFESGDPTRYLPDLSFGNTLFQMLVPVEFKAAARQTGNLILMVDGASANLPWEMLEVDGKPMVLSTRVVRQFVTARFRHQVVRTDTLTACVVSNPSTEGFHAQFGGPGWKARSNTDGTLEPDCLRNLPGATAEGQLVQRVLGEAGYAVTAVPPDATAGDVYARLFARPYRILMISAHGIHALRAADGSYRSGVVLSDGLLLSASEIGLMENVPDLVFLNCCHLGKIGPEAGAGSNRLAYSLARELIDMGVRCVVAAGWEVNDAAAHTFTEVFFDQMANHNAGFGEALREARRATHAAHPGRNTWGAYQAYGDPAFQLKIRPCPEPDDKALRAPDELLDWIEQRRLDSQLIPAAVRGAPGRTAHDAGYKALDQRLRRRLKHVPAAWLDMPEINEALGRLHAEYGAEGFAAARAAYLRAIGDDSSRGMVPISAIEQLANLEARQAQRLGEQGQTDEAMARVDDAIARLQALLALSADSPAGPSANSLTDRVNTERLALLGSAYKRKAIVLAHADRPWQEVAVELARARDAYARSAGQAEGSANWNPYNYLNQIQLDALLGTHPNDLANALTICKDAANARFARSYDFFDAVMPADAEVARWLHTGEGDGQSLARAYDDAMRGLTRSRRELDSVITQIRILTKLLQCRLDSLAKTAKAPDTRRIDVLLGLIAALGGETAASADGGKGAPENGAGPKSNPG